MPVQCLAYEGLIESTEGFTAAVTPAGAPLFAGVDFDSFPPILGYNQVLPRQGCDVLLALRETGDPLAAVGQFDQGKVLAYMSDPAPPWGCNCVFWSQYPAFWLACLWYLLQ